MKDSKKLGGMIKYQKGNEIKPGKTFQQLVDKYKKSGWDALTDNERSQYRKEYSKFGSNEFGAHILDEAVVEGNRVPYGASTARTLGKGIMDNSNRAATAFDALGQVMQVPLSTTASAYKKYGVLGLMPPVAAYNAFTTNDRILPDFEKAAAKNDLPDWKMSPEQKAAAIARKNQIQVSEGLGITDPYIAAGVDIGTGFAVPGMPFIKGATRGANAISRTQRMASEFPESVVRNDLSFGLSPLNLFGSKLPKDSFYRKMGNKRGMESMIQNKGISSPDGVGADHLFYSKGNSPMESYGGIYATSYNPELGTSVKNWQHFMGPRGQHKGLSPVNNGGSMSNVPLDDPGLEVWRRLPFSNAYRKMNKQRMMEGKQPFAFQPMADYAQRSAERIGKSLIGISTAQALGNNMFGQTNPKYKETYNPQPFGEPLVPYWRLANFKSKDTDLEKKQTGGLVNNAKNSLENDRITKKYANKGWDALNDSERAQYRQMYDQYSHNEFGAHMLPEATVEGNRVPYGTSTRQSLGKGIQDNSKRGAFIMDAIGQVGHTPLAAGMSSLKRYGPMGLNPIVGAYNYATTKDRILPDIERAAAIHNLPDWKMSKEQREAALARPGQYQVSQAAGITNPYLAAGVDIGAGFLTPGVGIAKMAKPTQKVAKGLTREVLESTPNIVAREAASSGNPTSRILQGDAPMPSKKDFRADPLPREYFDDQSIVTDPLEQKKIVEAAIRYNRKVMSNPLYTERARELDLEHLYPTSRPTADDGLPKPRYNTNPKKVYESLPIERPANEMPFGSLSPANSPGKAPSKVPGPGIIGPLTSRSGVPEAPRSGLASLGDSPDSSPLASYSFERNAKKMLLDKKESAQGIPHNTAVLPQELVIMGPDDIANGVFSTRPYHTPLYKADLETTFPKLHSPIGKGITLAGKRTPRELFNTTSHELKHYETVGNSGLPMSYRKMTRGLSKNDRAYVANPTEVDAFSRNMRMDMLNKGILKSPFEKLSMDKFHEWTRTKQGVLSSNVTDMLRNQKNSEDFVKYFNKTLPVVTGAAIGANEVMREKK